MNIRFWLKFSLFNLCIVALLGVLMRYKIGFEFPYLSQKYLQYAHSHFAFAGWISHSIYVLIVYFMLHKVQNSSYAPYRRLLIANMVCAYGMLFSFSFQGYSLLSIVFSSGTIVIACVFTYFLNRDFKGLSADAPGRNWFIAALWFNILSSAGTVYLAYIMATHHFNENWYLAAVYFYLHFQYNGFFVFSCMGLTVQAASRFLPEYRYNPLLFRLFFVSVIPAYFLSTLWAKLPLWLYCIVVVAAFIQVLAWFLFVRDVRRALPAKVDLPMLGKYLLLFVAIAFSVKLFLQLGSTIPLLSKLAFGFRPVVIAYLHLILLAVISVFLLTYMYSAGLLRQGKTAVLALTTFVVGVFLNELVLAVQGVASFSYTPLSSVNVLLFLIALILFAGSALLWYSQRKPYHPEEENRLL